MPQLIDEQLQQRVQELDRAFEEHRQRIEEERRLTEEERCLMEEARRLIEERRLFDEKQKLLEQENAAYQNTTLDEYIKGCHNAVFPKLKKATNSSLQFNGLLNQPEGKYCPRHLEPWGDFSDLQEQTLRRLYQAFPSTERLFDSQSFLLQYGNKLAQRPMRTEQLLEYFITRAILYPVDDIIKKICTYPDVKKEMNMENSVGFFHDIEDVNDMTENDEETDQICVYLKQSDDPRPKLVYFCEYMPPHELTLEHLSHGLHAMDIVNDVVNRTAIPTEESELTQYNATKLTAAVIAQIYHYMIQDGLEYGLLTTSEATVFFKIDWLNPDTLYYHLSETVMQE